MIKVRIVPSEQPTPWKNVGLAGASIALLGGGDLGCAAPTDAEDVGETSSSAYTLVNPGTGTLDLQYAWGSGGYSYLFNATNSVDEYVRVGEQMTINLPVSTLWSKLYPNDALSSDLTRLKKLQASVKVLFLSKGATLSTKTLSIASFTGANMYDLVAKTSSFTIPAKTDALGFDVTVTDSSNATASAHAASTEFQTIPVFGGELPTKHVLFDNYFNTLRQRVVEGGKPVIGSDLVLTYTDWRANTLMDTSSIDRQIGQAQSFGRFGSFVMPIYGELVHEVSFGVKFDVDSAWHAETKLPETKTSRLLPSGRTAYEMKLTPPTAARAGSLYFHVKTYLVADYSSWGNVTNRKYAQGARILVRERWDNLNGKAGQNYEFSFENR